MLSAKHMKWGVWVISTLFALALVAAWGMLVMRHREQALKELRAEVQQQAAQSISVAQRSLVGASMGLAKLPDWLAAAAQSQPGTPEEPGTLSTAASLSPSAVLKTLTQSNPSLLRVSLFTADGKLLAVSDGQGQASSHLGTAGAASAAEPPAPDQAQHQRLVAKAQQESTASLVLGEVVRNAAHEELALLVARRLRLPGGIGAVAVAEVAASALLAPQSLPEGRLLTLESNDGRLLLSVPTKVPAIGQMAGPVLPQALLSGQAHEAQQRLGGKAAIQAAQVSGLGGVVLVSSADRDTSLSRWRENSVRQGAVLLLLILINFAVATAAHSQLRQLQATRRQLDRSVAVMDHALSAMAEGFLLCDAQDRVIHWNENYLAIFPWTREVIAPGVPFQTLAEHAVAHVLPEGSAEQHRQWVQMRVQRHRAGHGSWEQTFEDGRHLTLEERITPEGGVVSVYHDATTAELRLRQAKQAAEEANRSKSRFLANMSHEIRTPLNAVLGLNALMLGSMLQPEQRKHAELIRSSGQLLLMLINDILDLSRIEAGQLKLEELAYSPRQLAREVVALVSDRAQQKQLRLALRTPGLKHVTLLGDPLRLRQVMFNLLGNALKFTEQGGVSVHLRLFTAQGQQPQLQIVVQDSGIGMDAQTLAKVFERFTQADDSTARRYGGSGLGLSITREIVQMMGGWIDAASVPGEGSRFEVQLPVRLAAASAGCATSTTHAPGAQAEQGSPSQPGLAAESDLTRDPTPAEHASKPVLALAAHNAGTGDSSFSVASLGAPVSPLVVSDHQSRLSLLVAEDNPVNQILIRSVLERLGHRCEVVSDGALALAQAQQAPYDAILMDMQMPVMDGLAATRAVRQLPAPVASIAIIAMTANARQEDQDECMASGMNAYLSKPLDFEALKRTLQNLTEAKSGQNMGNVHPQAPHAPGAPGATSVPSAPLAQAASALITEQTQACSEALNA